MANNKKKEDNVVEKAKEDAKQRVADEGLQVRSV